MSRRQWKNVTRAEPCTRCGKPDYCRRSSDGWVRCKRCDDPPQGMVKVQPSTPHKDGGALFRPLDGHDELRRRIEGAPHCAFDAFSAFGDPCQLQAKLVNGLTPQRLRELAGQLGVTEASLLEIGLGWHRGRWTHPERDEQRRIIGINTRSRSGRKVSLKGSHRGVVIPDGLDHIPGPVLLVEGGSDVAACTTMGLASIGRPSNVGGVQIIAKLNLGRRVIVVGENDQKENGDWPGQFGAISTATNLAEEWGEEVSWTMAPRPFKDIRAWLNERIKRGLDLRDPEACRAAGQELLAELEAASTAIEPQSGLVLLSLDTVTPLEVEWLWERRIPRGMLSILGGDPGLGKSTVAQDIAARVTRGGSYPDGSIAPAGEVLWLTSEDDIARVVVPKLRAAGADMSKVKAVAGVKRRGAEETPFSLEADLQLLERALRKRPNIALVVIDPLLSYLGKADYVNYQEIYRVLSPLKQLGEKYGVAVLGIAHLNKSMGSNAIHRLMGSAAFGASARAIWLICPDTDNLDACVMVCAKLSVGPLPMGLRFRIGGDGPTVRWDREPVTTTAREALAASMADPAEESGCAAWLRDRLRTGGGWARDIEADAQGEGFKEGQLRTARRRLGIKPQKRGMEGGWWWELPNRVSTTPAEGVEGAEGDGGGTFDAPSANQHGDSGQESV